MAELGKLIAEKVSISELQFYRINHSSGSYSLMSDWGTGNCQLFTIGWTNYVLKDSKNKDDKNHFVKVMEALRSRAGKNLCLVDVSNDVREELNSIYEGFIVLDAPYNSSNGSSMAIMIIHLLNFRVVKRELFK